jgi:stage III sporulation protein AC
MTKNVIHSNDKWGFGNYAKLPNKKGAGIVDINIIFRVAGIGILVSVLCIVLKQANKEEQAQLLTLAGVVVVLIIVVQLMNQLFTTVRSVFGL